MARSGSWKPGPGDTLAVAVTGVFPPVTYTLHHRGTGLKGRGQPFTEVRGAGADTTSWAVALQTTPCAAALALLEPGGSRPLLPSAVRGELVAMGDSDQAVRKGASVRTFSDTVWMRRMARSDSTRSARLMDIVARWGWPSPSRAGETAAADAFLVLQHSPSARFQRRMLPVLDSLAKVGEVDGQELALLTDRVLKREGLPQRYGSQFEVRNGVIELYTIEDSAGVDARRAALGLMPLATYMKLLEKFYAPSSPRPPGASGAP